MIYDWVIVSREAINELSLGFVDGRFQYLLCHVLGRIDDMVSVRPRSSPIPDFPVSNGIFTKLRGSRTWIKRDDVYVIMANSPRAVSERLLSAALAVVCVPRSI
ncbi:MAG TPA: hypothetical protein VKM55_01690 [Candidatus Lokiarchaeia archaeon]|nr:hypothetical protein [Candidatus Lokiarchaeia archaeon]